MISNFRRRARGIAPTLLLLALVPAHATGVPQEEFDTPEQAVAAMSALIGGRDMAAVERVFGAGSADLFSSGDEAEDRADFQRVKEMIAAKVAFADDGDGTKVALLGDDAWPWPIPLVKDGGKWRFDTASGREELLNRRIGSNELETLAALREIIDAQREYASAGRDGKPPAYARKFRSSEGKHDGLYWPPAAGGERSPLGDLLAASDVRAGEPRPFHGYYYRILAAQGKNAPGGARSYLDADGNMRGGFAVLAWPAKYGNSGVMSFLMSQRGIIYQKDLGEGTEKTAAGIQEFDPDASWGPTGDAGELLAE